MSSHRMDKISEEIKRELSEVLRELKDPRIPSLVSVVAVTVTKDLKFAKAFVSVFGSDEIRKNAVKGLNSGAGFVRKEIGRRIALRNVPEFTFELDDSIEHGAHINEIIHKLHDENK